MKKLLRNIVFMLLVGLLTVSCTKRIDIPLKPGDETLVVEGYLFGGDSVSWVRLTKTSGYFSNEPSPAVSQAQVMVSHKKQYFRLEESASEPGTYFLNDTTFHLTVADTYKLDIQLKNPVGNQTHFVSSTVVPPLRIHVDSLEIEYAPDIERWMIRFFGQDIPGKDYYLFNSSVNGKIVTDSILKKAVREDKFFDGRYISGALVQVLDKDVMEIGDHYTLMASNITKEYYDYIVALQKEVGEKNPLFSGPPSNVGSNISNGAQGFFTSFFTTSYTVKLKKKEKRQEFHDVRKQVRKHQNEIFNAKW